jgi:hypothetical protein
LRKRSRTEEGEEISVTTARNWTEGKRVDSVEEVVVREVEEMSARTMRVQPSWANAVAVALPIPVFFVGMKVGVVVLERLTRGCTGD